MFNSHFSAMSTPPTFSSRDRKRDAALHTAGTEGKHIIFLYIPFLMGKKYFNPSNICKSRCTLLF